MAKQVCVLLSIIECRCFSVPYVGAVHNNPLVFVVVVVQLWFFLLFFLFFCMSNHCSSGGFVFWFFKCIYSRLITISYLFTFSVLANYDGILTLISK